MAHLTNLRIDGTTPSATHTDYVKNIGPSLPSGVFSAATASGGDLRFFLSDGTTEIPREIVSFDTVGEEAEIWIKIPTLTAGLSGTDDTVIQIHADGSSADYAVTATYGRNAVWADYEVVDHAASGVDSTGNTTPSVTGTLSQVAGPLGAASEYTGSQHVFYGLSGGPIGTSSWWLSAWGAPTDGEGSQTLFSIADKDATNNQDRFVFSDGSDEFQISSFGGTGWGGTAATKLTASLGGVFDFCSAAFNGSTSGYIQINGVANTEITVLSAATAFDRVSIGKTADSTPVWGFDGPIAEFRARLSYPSTDWIADEYADQSGNSLWHTYEAVSSGTNVNVSSASLSLTENVATIVFDKNVLAASVSLSLSPLSSTIQYTAGSDTEVNASPVSLTLTENAASIGYDVNIPASSVALVLTPIQASVGVGVTTEVSVDTVSFTLTPNAAGITFDTNINVSTEALSLTTHSATLLSDVEVNAGVTTLTLTELQSTVSLTNFNYINAYNGSVYATGILKRWNGSEWVTNDILKRYNGSTYVAV